MADEQKADQQNQQPKPADKPNPPAPPSPAKQAAKAKAPISVVVSPPVASLMIGKTQQFTAKVTGGNGDTSVKWSTTRGKIDDNGLFTSAPGDPCKCCGYTPSKSDLAGNAIISATSVEDAAKVSTAIANVYL
jgi:hypothetical protein